MNDSSTSKRPRHCYHRRQFLVGGDDYWNSPPDFQTDPTSATGVQYKHRTCKMAMMMMMVLMMILLIMDLVMMVQVMMILAIMRYILHLSKMKGEST